MKLDFEVVVDLVRKAGSMLLDRDEAHQVTVKGLADYVTKVDFAVQSFLQQELAGLYPDIQFLGEEGNQAILERTQPLWILDPVDGTTNLIHDLRASCISLALWDGSKLCFGCIYDPFRQELYCARLGDGAFCNGKPISVSDRPTLDKSLVLVGTCPYEKERADFVFERIKRTYLASEDIRRSGSAALDLCAVACGRCDAFWEYNLKPWDFAAGAVILTEAGGQLTDVNGQAISPLGNSDIVATNGQNHAPLLALLQ
jgi:myo-inositol-1(or 4)-monophosphatase